MRSQAVKERPTSCGAASHAKYTSSVTVGDLDLDQTSERINSIYQKRASGLPTEFSTSIAEHY